MVLKLLPLLALGACAKAPPAPAADGTTVTLGLVMEGLEQEGSDFPGLRAALADTLRGAGLTVVPGDDPRATSTEARLAEMAIQQPDWLVLVEATPTFVSQVAGQYRWQVDLTLSIAPGSSPGQIRSWEREVPVYLRFYHEREQAAVDASAARAERHLGMALREAGLLRP